VLGAEGGARRGLGERRRYRGSGREKGRERLIKERGWKLGCLIEVWGKLYWTETMGMKG
jgi:hypothetical protein